MHHQPVFIISGTAQLPSPGHSKSEAWSLDQGLAIFKEVTREAAVSQGMQLGHSCSISKWLDRSGIHMLEENALLLPLAAIHPIRSAQAINVKVTFTAFCSFQLFTFLLKALLFILSIIHSSSMC